MNRGGRDVPTPGRPWSGRARGRSLLAWSRYSVLWRPGPPVGYRATCPPVAAAVSHNRQLTASPPAPGQRMLAAFQLFPCPNPCIHGGTEKRKNYRKMPAPTSLTALAHVEPSKIADVICKSITVRLA